MPGSVDTIVKDGTITALCKEVAISGLIASRLAEVKDEVMDIDLVIIHGHNPDAASEHPKRATLCLDCGRRNHHG